MEEVVGDFLFQEKTLSVAVTQRLRWQVYLEEAAGDFLFQEKILSVAVTEAEKSLSGTPLDAGTRL